jgi:hypothetical protein
LQGERHSRSPLDELEFSSRHGHAAVAIAARPCIPGSSLSAMQTSNSPRQETEPAPSRTDDLGLTARSRGHVDVASDSDVQGGTVPSEMLSKGVPVVVAPPAACSTGRPGSRVEGLDGTNQCEEDQGHNQECIEEDAMVMSGGRASLSGPSELPGVEVHRHIEMQIEMQERTMQLQLQLQMMVHRTLSLHRKLEGVVARQTSLVPNTTSADDGLTSEHRALVSDQREIERELKKQQSLLKQQMDCQEVVRQKLLDDAKSARNVGSAGSKAYRSNTN